MYFCDFDQIIDYEVRYLNILLLVFDSSVIIVPNLKKNKVGNHLLKSLCFIHSLCKNIVR